MNSRAEPALLEYEAAWRRGGNPSSNPDVEVAKTLIFQSATSKGAARSFLNHLRRERDEEGRKNVIAHCLDVAEQELRGLSTSVRKPRASTGLASRIKTPMARALREAMEFYGYDTTARGLRWITVDPGRIGDGNLLSKHDAYGDSDWIREGTGREYLETPEHKRERDAVDRVENVGEVMQYTEDTDDTRAADERETDALTRELSDLLPDEVQRARPAVYPIIEARPGRDLQAEAEAIERYLTARERRYLRGIEERNRALAQRLSGSSLFTLPDMMQASPESLPERREEDEAVEELNDVDRAIWSQRRAPYGSAAAHAAALKISYAAYRKRRERITARVERRIRELEAKGALEAPRTYSPEPEFDPLEWRREGRRIAAAVKAIFDLKVEPPPVYPVVLDLQWRDDDDDSWRDDEPEPSYKGRLK